ncbi:MAG: TetR family transcriptional regulator [Tannerellaceae bacterium]|jgi:AcrR family transcriptional regulator|nr:TetR family transcriptional regulator [Tannerellaceae bacterium]
MPKATSITKEMIIASAFEIVRREGFSSLSARNISKEIGCSTQPIYWVYKNMDDLKQDVISKMIVYLKDIITNYKKTGKPFLDYGLGYIYTAHTEPTLFKAIYVDNILEHKITDIIPEKTMLEIMRQDTCTADISDDKLLDTAIKSWVCVHGLASLIACGMMIYDEDNIKCMLESFFS